VPWRAGTPNVFGGRKETKTVFNFPRFQRTRQTTGPYFGSIPLLSNKMRLRSLNITPTRNFTKMELCGFVDNPSLQSFRSMRHEIEKEVRRWAPPSSVLITITILDPLLTNEMPVLCVRWPFRSWYGGLIWINSVQH